ncbi:MAG TPA: serine/threonine-protein kinase, partial [Rubrobacter sp.]|nr:serine/threonine-protein kinase [Rubrobacter sp.]
MRELGFGGMARVFLGRDEVLDRPVAVKVVEPDAEDPEIGLRFQREGRAAARLSHPNIVRVFDAGEDKLEGRAVSYIVMEYVPGGDLQDLMDRNGPLPETMLSRVGADVAAGLAHAHARGIVHRDVKPRNILLDDRGSPKLADFGIARALD